MPVTAHPPLSALRVEFLKSRARARRWTEEVLLLREEQWRVCLTLEKVVVAFFICLEAFLFA